MDIINFPALVADNREVKLADLAPSTDYVIVGKYIPSVTGKPRNGTQYKEVIISVAELLSGGGGGGVTSVNGAVGGVTLTVTNSGVSGAFAWSGTQLRIPTADTLGAGLLSAVDWNTFNNKVGGSGTLNYAPKWSASNTLTDSQLYDDGTNVGISTIIPTARLSVLAASDTAGAFVFKLEDSTTANLLSIRNDGNFAAEIKAMNLATSNAFTFTGTIPLGAAANYFRLFNVNQVNNEPGALGIAFVTTISGLGANTAGVFTNTTTGNAIQFCNYSGNAIEVSSGNIYYPSLSSVVILSPLYYTVGGRFYSAVTDTTSSSVAISAGSVKTNGTAYGFYSQIIGINAGDNIGAYLTAQNGANNYALLVDQGLVGMGTLTPTYKLDVVGTVNATAYRVGGVAGTNFSGAITNITVVNGIVTAAS
jgi:hypothetical protein